MGFSVAVQGVLQAIGYAVKPLIPSFLRLVVFVFPIALIFTRCDNVLDTLWWTFPIAEILTDFFSYIFLIRAKKEKIDNL